jgi:hypothetical protein
MTQERIEGLGRIPLEGRVARLTAALAAIEQRLQARIDNSTRTHELHPDPVVRQCAFVRARAYACVLDDLRDAIRGVGD